MAPILRRPRRAALGAALALIVALPAHAADPGLGERIAVEGGGDTITACNSCHDDAGQGVRVAGFPSLAGRRYADLLAQLDAFADGRRAHPVMTAIAKAMTPAQRRATAAWYAQLPSAR